jgi:hypothetical protein
VGFAFFNIPAAPVTVAFCLDVCPTITVFFDFLNEMPVGLLDTTVTL